MALLKTNLYEKMLEDRSIMLTGEIDDNLADIIIMYLFHMEADDKTADISVYINSPGGSVTSALAMYDVMQYIQPKINTICIGQACSAASIILCCGDERFMTEHARLLLHQPSGSVSGQVSDLRIQAAEINRMYDIIKKIYQKHTKVSGNKLVSLLDRDTILNPLEAKELGFIDIVLEPRKNQPNLLNMKTKK